MGSLHLLIEVMQAAHKPPKPHKAHKKRPKQTKTGAPDKSTRAQAFRQDANADAPQGHPEIRFQPQKIPASTERRGNASSSKVFFSETPL